MNERIRCILLIAALVVTGTAAASSGDPVTETAAARPPFLTTELFAFHSEPEINLHHFLLRWATLEAPPGTRVPELPEIPLWESDRAGLAQLTETERKTWAAAVAFYGERLVGRSLLFDHELVAIRDALTGKGSREEVAEADRVVFDHLDHCLPIYRRHWWDRHDRIDREWVAAMAPLLVRHERRIASRIAAAYEAEWPSPPNRVDAVAYSNRTSAYTTGEPHAIIAAADPALRPPWGFEILFHEHSHSDALEQPLRAIVHHAFESRGLQPPRNLWHILLFATAGEVVRSVRVAAGEIDYVPYAWENRVFTRSEIDRRAWKSVAEQWVPALAKGEPLSAVIDVIAADLVPSMEGGERR